MHEKYKYTKNIKNVVYLFSDSASNASIHTINVTLVKLRAPLLDFLQSEANYLHKISWFNFSCACICGTLLYGSETWILSNVL